MTRTSYETAGVNIKTGDAAAKKIKDLARVTHPANVLHGIGLFSGFYELDIRRYTQPVIVSSVDGVGTKVKVAEMAHAYDTVGQDLVNHCINDIAVCGSDPLFFADYIAADKLKPVIIQDLVKGISIACRASNCALIGGETAEMPGVYQPDNFDLAGSITGIVEKGNIIDGQRIEPGDLLIGVESNGIHTNGYSLVRKIFFTDNDYRPDSYVSDLQAPLGAELLRIHRCYLPLIQKLKLADSVHGISHITGGGIVGNTRRLLAESLSLDINWESWQPQPIFAMIADLGKIPAEEMRQVFNMGIGLIFIVAPDAETEVLETCRAEEMSAWTIGSVIKK